MKKGLLAFGLLAGCNGLILGVSQLMRHSIVDGWIKGPLIDPAAPYAPENAQWLFAIGMCVVLNIYILTSFAARQKPNKWVPALCLLFSIGCGEIVLQCHLHFNQSSYFRPHPTLHWVVRSNLVDFPNETGGGILNTNEDGLRGAEARKPKGDRFRILVLGDSSNFGHGVSEDEMWSEQLEQILHKSGYPEVEVLNGSCPGWTTYQAVEVLNHQYSKYKPDLVIAGFNNDSGPDFLTDRERIAHSPALGYINGLLFHSELFLLGREAILSITRRYSPTAQKAYQTRLPGEKGTYGALSDSESLILKERVPLKEFETNLSDLEAWSNSNNTDFVWINMPINRREPELVERYVNYEYRTRAQTLSDQSGFTVIDVDDRWLRTREPNLHIAGHVFHPNSRGHRRLAEQVALELIQGKELPHDATKSPIIDGPKPAPRSTTLRLGYSLNSPIHSHIGSVLEQHPELIDKYGLDIELLSFSSGKDQGEALAKGRIDAWFSCSVPAVHMLDSRPDSRILHSLGVMGKIAIVSHKDIETIGGLEGKTIAFSKGSTPEMDWINWSSGLEDIETLDTKTALLEQSLYNNSVDAVVGWDPWISQWLSQHPDWHILAERPFYSVLIGTHLWSITPDGEIPRAKRLTQLIEEALLLASQNRPYYDVQVALKSGWSVETVKIVSEQNDTLSVGRSENQMTLMQAQLLRALQFVHPEQSSIDRLMGEGLLKGQAFKPPVHK